MKIYTLIQISYKDDEIKPKGIISSSDYQSIKGHLLNHSKEWFNKRNVNNDEGLEYENYLRTDENDNLYWYCDDLMMFDICPEIGWFHIIESELK